MSYKIVVFLGLVAILETIGMFLRKSLVVAFLATGILANPSGISIINPASRLIFWRVLVSPCFCLSLA